MRADIKSMSVYSSCFYESTGFLVFVSTLYLLVSKLFMHIGLCSFFSCILYVRFSSVFV